jgi:DNA end-binding protein Ku
VDPTPELGKTTTMARAIWSGSLSFGLVNVPVGLYSATQDKTIHFNQFEEGTSDRIRYKKVNERTGREVAQSKIVKGFNLGDDQYVMLSDDELTAADPERSRTISILDFVDASQIDSLRYRSGYYLAPQGEGSRRAYALLREAMAEESKVAVATLVMRNKEYLATVRPDPSDGVLILQTMYFSDEVRSPSEELPNLPQQETFSDRELAIARQLIDAMTSPWDAERYHDSHRQRVEEIVASKHEGHEIVLEAPAAAPKVIDLMAALEASVKAASGGTAAKTTSRRTAKTGSGGTAPKVAAKAAKATKTAAATRRTEPAAAASASKPNEQRRSARRRAS